MRTVYEAANAVEAHMLADLLKQEGLQAHVRGEHLQGAAGGLPVAGLVRLDVDEASHDRARALIAQWEATQVPPGPKERPAPARFARTKVFMAGLALGVVGTWAFLRAPATSDGIDHNRDGVIDERWIYSASGTAMRYEADRNLDKKVDLRQEFNERGQIASSESDDDFDGVFETRTRYRNSNVEVSESDFDRNGIPEVRWNHENGVLRGIETIVATRGLPSRVDRFEGNRIVSTDLDTDDDGKLDTRLIYSPMGLEASRSRLASQ